MPYYEWEASACNLEEVNAEDFCRVAASLKGLLIVGECRLYGRGDASSTSNNSVSPSPLAVTGFDSCIKTPYSCCGVDPSRVRVGWRLCIISSHLQFYAFGTQFTATYIQHTPSRRSTHGGFVVVKCEYL